MKKHLAATIAAAITLGTLVAGCGNTGTNSAGNTTGAASKTNFKVGLVTDTGGLNDHGFNYLADQGLVQAEKQLGVTGSVVQSQDANSYVPNLQRFASQGYNLVIAVGFLMEDAVKQVAPQYPNTKFLIIDDPITGISNVTSAMFKTEQCGYLVGAMAGLLEKQNKLPGLNSQNILGVVGGQNIPPVTSYIAGFQQGVQKTDPGAKVEVTFANSFSDQALGSQIAQQEISDGADILFQVAGGTGIGVINAAKSKHVYAIGVDADQAYLAKDTVLTSATKGVDTATFDVIQQAVNNQWKSGIQYFDLKNNGVGLGSINANVPSDVKQQVDALAQQIKDGTITVSANMQQ
ncbi:BMP family ABC transporter substrate-binding protein [Alicyclobacillus contaminans]|uniref:BMP family lipoprotein n=1 Tax=Alicyclobacillus contaminans TaxID=392016 RepID=UPI00040923D4|nr:BMP family ABC transporter substrate-binding protein [Alicyclobacillus contaminans]GMA49248.1 BMP family ABC transporter substrate-binding protein [Alicyclobacillus contaminans]